MERIRSGVEIHGELMKVNMENDSRHGFEF